MTHGNKINFFSKIFNKNKSLNIDVRTPPNELPIAYISIKEYGVIKAELYPHIAPNTVNNFIFLANSGFYNGLIFHRIIKNFVIQGGCPDGSGMGGPGYTIFGEFDKNKFRNDLKHTEGVLSMARSLNKNSGGSQFFIMTATTPHLDGSYAGFGKVIDGMDIVKKIEIVEKCANDRPIVDIVIESINVDTRGVDYPKPEKR